MYLKDEFYAKGIRLGEMAWTECAEILKGRHAIILPVCSNHQHAYHTTNNLASVLSTYHALAAAEKVMKKHKDMRVVVMPTLEYGNTAEFYAWPGTVGIEDETLIRVVYDILKVLIKQGWRNIMAMSGHHGNESMVEIACRKIFNEFPEKFPEVGLLGLSEPDLAGPIFTKGLPGIKANTGEEGIGHCGELCTAGYMDRFPELTHMEKAVPGKRNIYSFRKHVGPTGNAHGAVVFWSRNILVDESGAGTDGTKATKEQGKALNDAMIDVLAEVIEELIESESRR